MTAPGNDKLLWDVSLFALVGGALGFTTLLILQGVEYFTEQPLFEGASSSLLGSVVVLSSITAMLMMSVLLAASIGHTHARGDPEGGARRGLLAGLAGHVGLVVAYVVVLVVGFALLGAVGGVDRELLGEGGVVHTRLLGSALLGLVPAGLAGWGGGRLRASEEERMRSAR